MPIRKWIIIEDTKADRRPPNYGSTHQRLTDKPINQEASPADDKDGEEESVYLFWTQRWLRDQGYRPSSLSTVSDDEGDSSDDDSSVSSHSPSLTIPSLYPLSSQSPSTSRRTSTTPSSLFSTSLSWFSMCFSS
ncbi:hypothetical protein DM01DRAFT_1331632 [Hesseltinella vesiculosa]|uniref:Uncharacterized protein n=1 Tax=Hesseltinella vesiculosa TaxID=101127 RepID=A0A1X2GVW3_9FUNG|nr:hypothetical protein DM01DRAFT_1331632 [Hesseltinella vesiculosa]